MTEDLWISFGEVGKKILIKIQIHAPMNVLPVILSRLEKDYTGPTHAISHETLIAFPKYERALCLLSHMLEGREIEGVSKIRWSDISGHSIHLTLA